MVELRMGTKSFSAVVDTGLMVNLIRSSFVCGEKIKKSDVRLITEDGSELKTLGEVRLDVWIKGRNMNVDFLICKNLKIECILGMPFLKENKVVLKFGKKESVEFELTDQNKLGSHRIRITTEQPVVHRYTPWSYM
jgi:hypothetical protein